MGSYKNKHFHEIYLLNIKYTWLINIKYIKRQNRNLHEINLPILNKTQACVMYKTHTHNIILTCSIVTHPDYTCTVY